ncbi:MAG TPA: hypothetical protein VGS58_21115, partial [Candidatus Sulfopaludibacter sp.]|nr:hypothetical protein [Candidatus Sulfopaludibacter sp.]
MRKLIVLAVAGCLVVPADAARRLTVAQLAETLSTAIADHRSDEQIARQVSNLQLTERLTAPTLDRFAAKLPLQPRTALALELLADQSAFENPPAEENVGAAPPGADDQDKMLAAARSYAVQTWGRLPNFFVARTTTRFSDGAQVLHAGESPVRVGLHPVNTSTRQITFREGKEVLDPAPVVNPASNSSSASPPAKPSDELGLRSWGEFGPALTVVLADLSSHRITFSHWEQTSGGLAAVYQYDVPREASHYLVTYSYFDIKAMGRTQFGYSGKQRTAQQVANIPKGEELQSYHETPGYHGTIAIDPATGAVLRITIQANLASGDPLLRAETMIEYAPVTIGEKKFICPIRSLAISMEPGWLSGCGSGGSGATLNGVGGVSEWQNRTQSCGNSPVLLINSTKFADYHRLGSTARILTGGALASTPGADAPAAAAPSGSPEPEAPAPAAEPAASAPDPPAPAKNAESLPPPPPAPGPPPPPAEPVIPEISMTATDRLPDARANSAPADDTAFSIKVTSRLVDVGVLAYDKKGRPVTDLKPEDFELYDNGRKQEIRFFNPALTGGAGPSPPAEPATENHTFFNRAADAGSPLPTQ